MNKISTLSISFLMVFVALWSNGQNASNSFYQDFDNWSQSEYTDYYLNHVGLESLKVFEVDADDQMRNTLTEILGLKYFEKVQPLMFMTFHKGTPVNNYLKKGDVRGFVMIANVSGQVKVKYYSQFASSSALNETGFNEEFSHDLKSGLIYDFALLLHLKSIKDRSGISKKSYFTVYWLPGSGDAQASLDQDYDFSVHGKMLSMDGMFDLLDYSNFFNGSLLDSASRDISLGNCGNLRKCEPGTSGCSVGRGNICSGGGGCKAKQYNLEVEEKALSIPYLSLDKLYILRDDILKKSPIGRHFIQKYYELNEFIKLDLGSLFLYADMAPMLYSAIDQMLLGDDETVVIKDDLYYLILEAVQRHRDIQNEQVQKELDFLETVVTELHGKNSDNVTSYLLTSHPEAQ